MPAFLIALLGGLGAGLGHAPFHLWFLALPGFAAIIWVVTDAPTPRWSVFRAWVAATAYFALTLHWIVEPFLVDAATHGWMAPFALGLLAAGLALFWGVAGWGAHRLGTNGASRAIAFAALLTVAELTRGHIFTGFPWAMPAYVWSMPETIWVTSVTGSFGLTFLTLLIAALLTIRTTIIAPATALGTCALVWIIGSGFADQPERGDHLGTVGLVHPSVPQTEKWNRLLVPNHIDRLTQLTATAANDAPDMIVLPEVAVVYPLDSAEQTLRRLSDAAGPADLVTGINRRDGDDWHNSLIRLGPDGLLEETYDKVHLVPFGEYIPLRLGFIRALAATSSNGFRPGDAVRLIDTPLGRALPLICYEGIFPGHVFKAGERADYILLITNDAWFGTFAGPAQHFDQARFRAVEQGLSVVRVANMGLTAVIDPSGRVVKSLPANAPAAIVQSVRPGAPTLYSGTGDWPIYIALFLTITALLLLKKRNSIANNDKSS